MILNLILTIAIVYTGWKLVDQYLRFKTIPRVFAQIPFVGGTWGHTLLLLKQTEYKVLDQHQELGPVILSGPIGLPILSVMDPVEIKRLHNDTKLFPKSDFLQKLLVDVMEYGLANIASGPLHKKHRKILQPAFSPTHLRQVPDACDRVFKTVVNAWGSSGILDYDSEMLKITLDVLGYVAFGTNLGAVEGKMECTKLWSELENFLFNKVVPRRVLLPKFLWTFAGVGSETMKFEVKKYYSFFDSLIDSPETTSKLEDYNDDSKFELNFIERLILALRQDKLTRREVYDECLDFIIAGHETSSHTLAFLMWDLCAHPQLQEELYQSVKDIEDLKNTPVLDLFDRVLKESQRLHTLATGGIARISTADTTISGHHILKGSILQAAYRPLHPNASYYPDPLQFEPERWLDPETVKQPFFPFAGGDHACIGQKLALIEIKTLMILFLQKYQFSMTNEDLAAVKVTEPLTLKCNPRIQYVERK